MALGSYANFLNSDIPVLTTAIIAYVVFISINLFGIKESANFSFLITTLSVAEIFVFMVLIFPAFKTENFLANSSISANGVFAGIPFAIWFFVAIEGVAMIAEEVDRGLVAGWRTIYMKSLIMTIIDILSMPLAFIALISPLVPSYWSMNSLAATVDLVKISIISDPDLLLRWEHSLSTLTKGSFAVAGMSITFLIACFVVLVKKR
jgi:amino acid transporter